MIVPFEQLPTFSDYTLVDGGFDPLHKGHLAYFQSARVFGKPLLCAVASDDQIRAKGREPLFPQDSRAAIVEPFVDAVYLKDRPTEQIIEAVSPRYYVKGMEWEDTLPPEQVSACGRVGTELAFVEASDRDSSTARLRAWALKDADQSLDRLEAFAGAQTQPTFNAEYYTGDWRTTTEPYTWEGRKKAEGRHPKIVKECFEGLTVLDVGCGPGYFVRMLRELGIDAGGIDISPDAVALSNGIADRVVHAHVSEMPPKIAHVAICREVLEHVPVYEISLMVAHLFRVARKFVYLTTRFSNQSVFDAATDLETDPTHISLLSQPFLRSLCVLNGGKRRRDLEARLDHLGKGRVLVYAV